MHEGSQHLPASLVDETRNDTVEESSNEDLPVHSSQFDQLCEENAALAMDIDSAEDSVLNFTVFVGRIGMAVREVAREDLVRMSDGEFTAYAKLAKADEF